MKQLILGIETSCDETSAAVVEFNRGNFKVVSNIVSSQIKLHAKTGGVVPEVAAREHVKNVIPVVNKALGKVKHTEIDKIAVTYGPGLITSLMVGLQTAKVLSLAWKKPLVGVNHLEGHIYANWLSNPQIKFPCLCLIVSGGHTELVLIKKHGQYKKIGQTRDDAAGEAFDKVAKLLNIGYPGGPIISKRAELGGAQAVELPRPMIQSNNFDFSFAGLKTAVLYEFRKQSPKQRNNKTYIDNLCASFQQAAIDVLVSKTIRAATKYKVRTVMLAGGVAANKSLRNNLEEKVKSKLNKVIYLQPDLEFCTDNAAMIATAAAWSKNDGLDEWQNIKADPNLEIVTWGIM